MYHTAGIYHVAKSESTERPSSTVGRVSVEFLTIECYLNPLRIGRRRPFPL